MKSVKQEYLKKFREKFPLAKSNEHLLDGWLDPDIADELKIFLSEALDAQEKEIKKNIELEKLSAITKELARWASFFEDGSMNAMPPSERLQKRIKDLQEETTK